ncbi:XVIPCD domain-containing protein [Frateuria sp. YIM B11624]|uniref:XVIPCD domain-containing protein n=1 Tax=Frateuria sp. YIM B11624 TaxID=3143185 RepID=UPI003C75A3E4
MPGPNTHDLDALAGAMYFIVGRATEGGPFPYHLTIAGITFKGAEPNWGDTARVAVNSGYSLGTIQVDLGQRGTWPLGATKDAPLQPGQVTYVDGLISQVASYAKAHHLKFPSDTTELRAQLLSHGDGKRHRSTLVFIDPDVRDSINAWAGSGEGQSWIHRNIDYPQIRSATQAALEILDAAGRNIPEDRRLETIAILTKTANQRPAALAEFRSVLLQGGDYDDVVAKANEITRRHHNYAAPAAAAAASRYVNSYADSDTSAALDRAQAKVASVGFNPSTASTDPDIRKTLKTLGLDDSVHVLRQGSRGDQVIALQTDLAKLGFTDARGIVLNADGAFGPGTRAAVETFQRTHGLKPNGLAGQETLRVLHEATRRQAASLADAGHPGHSMFCQALERVHAIDARHGRTPDAFSANLAGSLATAAHVQGLERIDHVTLGEGATRAFAVQGDSRSPLRQIACVDVMQAITTPLALSSSEFLAASRTSDEQQAQGVQPQSPLVQSPLEGMHR